jgi:hypothetical protein
MKSKNKAILIIVYLVLFNPIVCTADKPLLENFK